MFRNKMKLFFSFFILIVGVLVVQVESFAMPTVEDSLTTSSQDSITMKESGEGDLNSVAVGEKQFKWTTDHGTVELDVILRVTSDGTLYLSGGTLTDPDSLYSILDTQGIPQETITKIVIENPLYISGIASYIFSWLSNLEYFENLNKVDVSEVTRLDNAFTGCSKLQELDLSNFDLSNYKSDASGIFGACEELKKLILGPKYKMTSVASLTEPPQNHPAYTGKWRAVGSGTDRRPTGFIWDFTGDFMVYYDGQTQADTYVWEPVPAKITINYLDIYGTKIHSSLANMDRNVNENYDVTTPEYKLKIEGYQLDTTQLPVNAKGYIADREDIDVTYIYEKVNTPVIKTYPVDFVSNGGSKVPSQVVNEKEKAIEPVDPTKTGEKFVGWYIDKELTCLYDFDTPVVQATTLYAKWEQRTIATTTDSSTTDTTKVTAGKQLPQTGEKSSLLLLNMGEAMLVIFFYTVSRKKQR